MNKIIAMMLFSLMYVSQVQSATVDIVVSQVGDDVVFSGTGTVDLAGLGSSRSLDLPVSRSQFNLFGGSNGVMDLFDITIPTFVPLNGGLINFDEVSGDAFFLQGLNGGNRDQGFFGITSNYTSNDPLSFLWRVSDQSVSGLNLNLGTLAIFGNNTVTLAEASAVPIPGALPLFLSALIGTVLARRRQQRLA